MANKPDDKAPFVPSGRRGGKVDTSPVSTVAGKVAAALEPFDSPNKTLRLRINTGPTARLHSTGSLLVVAGSPPDIGRHIIVDNVITIGRSAEGLRLRDGNISRRHAQVDLLGKEYILTDLGSTNGTLLNGKRIAEPTKLVDGDTILLGQTVIKFHVMDEADGAFGEPPWVVLVADPVPGIHEVVRRSVSGTIYCGRSIEVVGAFSSQETLQVAKECESPRLAVALVDAGIDDQRGVELASKLRMSHGNALQILIYSERPEAEAREGSHFLPKQEVTPAKLRALLDISIRNFRSLTAMSVLCNTLSRFAALFEAASDNLTLNQLLDEAVKQYSSFWRFEYFVVNDMNVEADDSKPRNSWQREVLRQLRGLETAVYRSVNFARLRIDDEDTNETWGCVIKPIGGRFTSGFAIRVYQTPPPYLLEDLQTLLRAWALARTSLQVRQIIVDEQRIRTEMEKERREGIAKMVAGVAHEVNTPLGIARTAACTIAQILARVGEGAESIQNDLEDLQQSARLIMRSIARAGELIQNFKRLSVGQLVDTLEELDLVKTIQGIVQLYASQSNTSIEIQVHDHTEPGCRTWRGYAGHLSQVILNLLTNVEWYAYPEDCRAQILQQRPRRRMTVDLTVSSRMVGDVPEFAVSFTDYGVGMAPHRLPVIFDPFYTTGRERGATGLGLSIVYNIVTNIFGGSVRCQSTEGHGTTIFMTFWHCEPEKNVSSAWGLGAENVSIFQDFVALQRRYIRDGALAPQDQIRLADAANAVDRYLEVRFKQRHNNRLAPRIPTRRYVQICSDGVWETSELRDISEGGAMHVTGHQLRRGARLMMRYWNDSQMVIYGQVIDSFQIKSLGDDGAEWQTGIKFTDLNEELKRNLKLLIAEVMLEYWT